MYTNKIWAGKFLCFLLSTDKQVFCNQNVLTDRPFNVLLV